MNAEPHCPDQSAQARGGVRPPGAGRAPMIEPAAGGPESTRPTSAVGAPIRPPMPMPASTSMPAPTPVRPRIQPRIRLR